MRKSSQKRKKYTFGAKIAFFLVAVVLTALTACGQSSFQTIPGRVADFKGILIGNGSLSKKTSGKDNITSYSQQKGTKATLIVLTASWCPACQAEVPLLKKIYSEYESRGFKILLISEDDTPAVAARYKRKAELSWPMIHWNYDIMNALGNPGVIPVSYLVNEQDSIVKVDTGIIDDNAMRHQIEKLLK